MRGPGYDTLDFKFELKSLDDAGALEGYAAVFGNVDLGGDVIEQGAFTKSIQESGGQVPILWQHDRYEPIGVSSSLEQDRKGLLVKGQLNMDVQRAREARALLNQGALQGLSVGYKSVKHVFDGPVRRLKEMSLKEFSPVVFPMNELAVASVKGAGDIIWEPESGFNDLMSDLCELLNPGATPNRFWVSDIAVDLSHAIVRDYDANEAWVVPISVDENGEPAIAPASDWVEAEQAWVAAADEPGKAAFAVANAYKISATRQQAKEGRMFSTANLAALKDAHEKITALLELAQPANATADDDGAAKNAEMPAYAATLRDSITSIFEGGTQ
jgi:uncharacterized protein